VKGKSVVIVDFSYPLNDILKVVQDCHGIVILDHHKTAAKALASLPKIDGAVAHDYAPGEIGAWFDMERSGVGLTWMFCCGADMVMPPSWRRSRIATCGASSSMAPRRFAPWCAAIRGT
jgi:hypothetical protein